jgi:hypothetical protein
MISMASISAITQSVDASSFLGVFLDAPPNSVSSTLVVGKSALTIELGQKSWAGWRTVVRSRTVESSVGVIGWFNFVRGSTFGMGD